MSARLHGLSISGIVAVVLATWATGPFDAGARAAPAPAPVGPPTAGSPAPRRIVVDFRDDISHDEIAPALSGLTFRAASAWFDVDEIYVVEALDAHANELLERLRRRSDVEAADYDVEYRVPEDWAALPPSSADAGGPARAAPAPVFPNDPQFKYQWHLKQIHAVEAWRLAQGKGVTVAVIDTGVAKVPDLARTEIVAGYNFVADNADATDDHGHGTHVAGTIAQSTHNNLGVAGVAFGAKIMPIKVLSARGSGSVSGIAAGIRFAADHGAKVINLSLGGPIASTVLEKAVRDARARGVVVVCAAGNDGRGRVSYPAAYPHAFAVAATQYDETTTFYSNWGKEIDIAAPGGNTRVDQNGDGMMDGVLQNTVIPGHVDKNDYLLFMGTSMASPHVAGVAALLVSAGVDKPDAVEKILEETARKPRVRQTDGENRYGAGIIDARAALERARKRGASTNPTRVDPLSHSAALPFALIALLLGVRRLRLGLVAVATATGVYLATRAFLGGVELVLVPERLEALWLAGNAAICFVLAALVRRRG